MIRTDTAAATLPACEVCVPVLVTRLVVWDDYGHIPIIFTYHPV